MAVPAVYPDASSVEHGRLRVGGCDAIELAREFGTPAYVIAEEGLGCDVASGGELHLALKAGFEPARIYLHGNAKAESELAEAVQAGVGTIVIDNHEDVAKLARVLAGGGRQR